MDWDYSNGKSEKWMEAKSKELTERLDMSHASGYQ